MFAQVQPKFSVLLPFTRPFLSRLPVILLLLPRHLKPLQHQNCTQPPRCRVELPSAEKKSVGTRHEPTPTAVSANAAPNVTSSSLEKSTVICSIMAAEKTQTPC
ncbi:MAG: hypothetical protein J7641_13605 [Cyanobacteria bacterium SID2]|nr:hypothetical protein [Cyanobacteria bacterium SID2]